MDSRYEYGYDTGEKPKPANGGIGQVYILHLPTMPRIRISYIHTVKTFLPFPSFSSGSPVNAQKPVNEA